MAGYLPKPYSTFLDRYPDVAGAHEAVGRAVGAAGPLDLRTRHLVQLGVAVGAMSEGAVKSHARRAIEAGAGPDEVRHVVLLSLPTCGFPGVVACLGWVDEVLEARARQG